MYEKNFAMYTYNIIKKLPYWFSIKKHSAKSIGADFLNCIGLELDDIKFILEYAYRQCYIETTDLNQLDCLYKTFLDSDTNIEDIQEVGFSSMSLKKTTTLEDFCDLYPYKNSTDITKNIPYYFIDEERKIIYVHYPYDKNNEYKDGKIYVKINNKKIICKLSYHHVWNFFDEFGMLLNCPRLNKESNENYKNRILDVFINPANSSKNGLLNGIARELNLRKYILWKDGSSDLIIEDHMIVLNKIEIDKKLVDLNNVYINNNNFIVLKGDPKYKNIQRKVSYISGIEMHSLNNENDISLFNELFNADGTATKLLKEYVEKINQKNAIKWNYFKYDETYWDNNTIKNTGFGYIPSIYDASIKGFEEN